MAAGNRSQNAFGRDSGAIGRESNDSLGSGLLTGHARGMALPVVLGIASAIGLVLSYLEIGPTSFRIAIFSCIIAGFVAALFQRRSLTQAEQVVAEERQARLTATRDLREEMAALRDAMQGARGPAVDLGPLRAELASLSGKVAALEQSQSTFRDSLVQEMNPGRGRRRGRAGDTDGGAAGAVVNGSTLYETPSYATASYEAGSYEPEAYATQSYEPSYASSSQEAYSSGTDPAPSRRSWSGAEEAPAAPAPLPVDDGDTANYGSTAYPSYDTGSGRPSWSTGSANGVENGSSGAANGNGRNMSSNPYNDAFAYAGTNAFGAAPSADAEQTPGARSALWESSAASRLATAGSSGVSSAGASSAGRAPWGSESSLPSRPAPGGRAAASSWEPQLADAQLAEPKGRTPWSGGSRLGDDEDPAAAAARHGSPRRGRPSDEDPHEMTQTQRLSASEQTAIRRRFLDLSSMEDDGWSRRR